MTSDTLSPRSREPETDLTDTEFGVWRALRQLGRGGMGAVYLVEHRTLHSRAAVKVLHRHLLADPDGLRRFTAEAEAVSRLNHPGIVTIFDSGTLESGQPWFAMEFVAGTTLEEALARGPFAHERVVNVIGQLASALDRAHEHGVIHRDLKPANVMLTRSGQLELVKVVDFGIAKLRGDGQGLTLNGAIVGTPDYMSPEQILGQAVDARTDVYALGVMAWELLVGAAPFASRGISAVLVAHLNDPPPSPSSWRADVPEAASSAVQKALAKKPDQRFPSAGAFADALRVALRPSTPMRATPLPVKLGDAGFSAGGRRAQLIIDGVRHAVVCEEESVGGCFVASDLKPPVLSTVSLQASELGEIAAVVVRRVDEPALEHGGRPAGFFLQFFELTPWQRVLLIGGGAAVDLIAEEALSRWRTHLWGSAYEALQIAPESSMAALAAAFGALDAEISELETKALSPGVRNEVDGARSRLTTVWAMVGTTVARAKYDAVLANWRGVAACLSAGLSISELASLRLAFLREAPDAEYRARMLMRLCRARLADDHPAEALAHLEAALELDPLNWLIHETRRILVDVDPRD